MGRKLIIVVGLMGALTGWPAGALAANYPFGSSRPFVEAGPGGHAVAIAGFGLPRAAFAPPGGSFGALSGGAANFGPDALALDASGSAVALDRAEQVRAFVAPPGGPFGPPVGLGASFGDRTLLAVGARGTAGAVWRHEGRLRIARRPAASTFEQTVDAGPASRVAGVEVTPGGAVQVLASRLRQPPSAGRSSDAVLITLRSGSIQAETVELVGEDGLALARAADGRLLVVMRALIDGRSEAVAQLVDASGRPQAGVQTLPGAGSGVFLDLLGAVLEPDGRAAVAWTSPGQDQPPSSVHIAEGNARSGFAAPRRLDRQGEVRGAQLARNARGDAVIVWSAPGYRPRAALRRAGATFGTPLILSGSAGTPPTAGMLPDGRALVGWTEEEGLVTRQVVVRVGEGGAQSKQTLAERSLDPDPRARSRCRAARPSVLRRSRFAVYRRTGQGRRHREICSLVTGIAAPVSDQRFGDFLESVRLAGPLYAKATVTGEDTGTSPFAVAAIDVIDTRTGRPIQPLGLDLGENVAVGDVALAPDGAYAVTVCSTGVDLFVIERPTRLARRLCSRRGHRTRVIVVDEAGPGRQRVVGRGRTIEPRSLQLRGRRVTWRQDGRTRSATLRAVQLPG